MGSFQHPRVFPSPRPSFEAAWAHIEAREPFRDRKKDEERKEPLRKLIMDNTGTGRVEFDTLCERVLANIPDAWTVFAEPPGSEPPSSEAAS